MRSTSRYDSAIGQVDLVTTPAIEPSEFARAGAHRATGVAPQKNALLTQRIAKRLRPQLGSRTAMVGGNTLWGWRSVRRCRSPSWTALMCPRFPAELACSITSILALVNRATAKVVSQRSNRTPLTCPRPATPSPYCVAVLSGSLYLQQPRHERPQSIANVTDVTRQTHTELRSMLADLWSVVRRAGRSAARSWQRSGESREKRPSTSRGCPGTIVSSYFRSRRSNGATAAALREKCAASVRTR